MRASRKGGSCHPPFPNPDTKRYLGTLRLIQGTRLSRNKNSTQTIVNMASAHQQAKSVFYKKIIS